jgi:hypothetical protein
MSPGRKAGVLFRLYGLETGTYSIHPSGIGCDHIQAGLPSPYNSSPKDGCDTLDEKMMPAVKL